MKYLIQMNETPTGYEIEYYENEEYKFIFFPTSEEAMLFMNTLNLTKEYLP
jgi:hypothetical protein